ncbi:MAG: ClpXP protease specificity-enhancing factor SspB [Gammaproteobacteria bacterium]|nr:ClpXP protease specificity-enhancing factor SspB [Gammaproteobacteria bacterium]
MTSFRWYLVDALIRWLVDNGCVPHIVIQCDLPDVEVPQEYVKDNRLVLNVSGQAVSNFSLGPHGIDFDARFDGVPRHVHAPAGAIVSVHAKGSTVGVNLEPELPDAEEKTTPTQRTKRARDSRPKLTIVE